MNKILIILLVFFSCSSNNNANVEYLFIKAISTKDSILLRNVTNEQEIENFLLSKYGTKVSYSEFETILLLKYSPIFNRKKDIEKFRDNFKCDTFIVKKIFENKDYQKEKILWYRNSRKDSIIVYLKQNKIIGIELQ